MNKHAIAVNLCHLIVSLWQNVIESVSICVTTKNLDQHLAITLFVSPSATLCIEFIGRHIPPRWKVYHESTRDRIHSWQFLPQPSHRF